MTDNICVNDITGIIGFLGLNWSQPLNNQGRGGGPERK